MDTLGAKLKEADIAYTPLVIYHTEMLYPTVSQEYDTVLFFSPSGIDSYRKNNKLGSKMLYGCIGNTTGAYLSSLIAGAEIIVADSPEP
jgi:uroporphyrinogen-III synthase